VDPTLRYDDKWFVRRLAPDAVKIETDRLAGVDDWVCLATAMGEELASVHLTGDRPERVARALLDDLSPRRRHRRDPDWLNAAAKRMAEQTETDHQRWKRR
jgi:hypothetical protein